MVSLFQTIDLRTISREHGSKTFVFGKHSSCSFKLLSDRTVIVNFYGHIKCFFKKFEIVIFRSRSSSDLLSGIHIKCIFFFTRV